MAIVKVARAAVKAVAGVARRVDKEAVVRAGRAAGKAVALD